MALKMLAFALCLLINQDVHAAVINQDNLCNIQTQQLLSQISLAANAARLEISTAVQTNRNNIAFSRVNIQAQIRALRIRAESSVGPNKQICLHGLNLALVQVNEQALNLCYENGAINLLNRQVNQINNLKGRASQICNVCGAQFPLPGEECVSSQIKDVQEQLVDLQGQVSSGAADLQNRSADCAKDWEKNANDVVRRASDDFDACIVGP